MRFIFFVFGVNFNIRIDIHDCAQDSIWVEEGFNQGKLHWRSNKLLYGYFKVADEVYQDQKASKQSRHRLTSLRW